MSRREEVMFETTELQPMEADAHTQARDGSGRPLHVPVLPAQVLAVFRGLAPSLSTGWLLDATLGIGGHTELLLENLPQIRVVGVDRDPAALESASRRLARFGDRVRVRAGRFSELSRLVRRERIGLPVGILCDLGASSMQLDTAARGFSFQADGPLDMRMDPALDRTAADIVNHWDESDLADLFFYEGGETKARRIAHAIVESRARAPFLRTAALADLIARTIGRGSPGKGGKIHPATRVFQALRRAVNEEGEELFSVLAAADHWLADGGRLCVIAFHSGEDGEVKRFLAAGAREQRWALLAKKPLEADADERRSNPRSRSARLRAAQRTRSVAHDAHIHAVEPLAPDEGRGARS
jgi:16S rRNA (cytosine1402-N4)-methyltransferase